jgi:hypothetical protein
MEWLSPVKDISNDLRILTGSIIQPGNIQGRKIIVIEYGLREIFLLPNVGFISRLIP